MTTPSPIYGLLAEFETAEALVLAAKRAREAGYRNRDAFSPFPVAYPVTVGGRPMASWPSFVPVSFELTILVAALCAVFGMLLMNGLPMPYHPLFNSSRFSLASSHAFFLCIEAADKNFNREETLQFLRGLQAKGVDEVEL